MPRLNQVQTFFPNLVREEHNKTQLATTNYMAIPRQDGESLRLIYC